MVISYSSISSIEVATFSISNISADDKSGLLVIWLSTLFVLPVQLSIPTTKKPQSTTKQLKTHPRASFIVVFHVFFCSFILLFLFYLFCS